MADMNSRGQILLIGAFTLAVLFVALALVINSAIFAENLASRGQVEGGSDALVTQHAIQQKLGAALVRINVHKQSGLNSSMNENLYSISSTSNTQQAESISLVNVSYESHTDGTRIADNKSGGTKFISGNSSDPSRDTWDVATNVDQTRNVVIEVYNGSLADTIANGFNLTARNSNGGTTDTWEMAVQSSGSDVKVTVKRANPEEVESCSVNLDSVSKFKIEVNEGLVNGARCSALTRKDDGTKMWFAAGVPEGYTINITNGDEIVGNYSMIIDGAANTPTAVKTSPSPGTPFTKTALYDFTVDYVYATSDVVYKTKMAVAPGDHP